VIRPPLLAVLDYASASIRAYGSHELLPEFKTKRGHMRAFSCFKGIYKRVRLCDDLRVKYHGLVLHSGFDVDSTLTVLPVD
jgi:hypothetical protein